MKVLVHGQKVDLRTPGEMPLNREKADQVICFAGTKSRQDFRMTRVAIPSLASKPVDERAQESLALGMTEVDGSLDNGARWWHNVRPISGRSRAPAAFARRQPYPRLRSAASAGYLPPLFRFVRAKSNFRANTIGAVNTAPSTVAVPWRVRRRNRPPRRRSFAAASRAAPARALR